MGGRARARCRGLLVVAAIAAAGSIATTGPMISGRPFSARGPAVRTFVNRLTLELSNGLAAGSSAGLVANLSTAHRPTADLQTRSFPAAGFPAGRISARSPTRLFTQLTGAAIPTKTFDARSILNTAVYNTPVHNTPVHTSPVYNSPVYNTSVQGAAAAAAGIAVDAGYAGAFAPLAPVPVRVTLTADRLVRGTLVVEGDAGAPIRVPIDLAGGSRKQVLILVPTPAVSTNISIRVSLDGSRSTAAIADVANRGDAELVGVLPGVRGGRPLPLPALLSIDAGTARFAAIGDLELLRAPGSLLALSAIAAQPQEIARLSEPVRSGIQQWIAQGGTLLLAADRGDPLTTLPGELRVGSTGRRTIGRGEIRATGRDLGNRSWDRIVDPTGVRERTTVTVGFRRNPPGIADELDADSGLRVPRVGWLAPLAIGYSLVSATLLLATRSRRGRVRAVYLYAPLLAFTTTGVVVVAGRSVRASVMPAHATVLDVGATGTEATTILGVARGEPGSATIRLPRNWTPIPLSTVLTNSSLVASSATQVQQLPQGTRVRVDLIGGAFGVVAARGPVPNQGGLELVARAERDDQVSGTVRNTTPWSLRQVAVFIDNASTFVGDVPAGATIPWTLFVPDVSNRASGGSWIDAWQSTVGFGGKPNEGVNFSAWADWASTRTDELLGPGRVAAVGWTRDRVVSIDLGGKKLARARGRTAVVGRSSIATDPKAPARIAVARSVVRTGPVGVARFDLPTGAGSALAVRALAGTSVDVWTPTGWTPIQPAATDGASSPVLTWNDLALPSAALTGGRVFVRAGGFVFADPSASPVDFVTVGALRVQKKAPPTSTATETATTTPPTTTPPTTTGAPS